MKKRVGFTLVELLAVIAIIAILSAIIFPVFARARENAVRSGDLSNLNSIRTALQLYRVDHGAFPPALLGYATRYVGGPQNGQIVPASAISGFLLPRRVEGVGVLKPGRLQVAENLITTAVWPNQDARAVGTAPIVDLNGDGRIIPADDDLAGARQAYGPTELVRAQPRDPASPALEFYQISGYDVAQNPRNIGAGSSRWELRYTLFWSAFAIGQGSGLGAGSVNDDPRQLGYTDPPDNTVLTWNSAYREWVPEGANRVPSRQRSDQVLFLGGAARPFDSRQVWDQSWRVLP